MKIFVLVSIIFINNFAQAGSYEKIVPIGNQPSKDALRIGIAESINNNSLDLVDTMGKLIDGKITLWDISSKFFSYRDNRVLIINENFRISGFTPLIWLLLHSYEDNVREIFYDKIFNEPWLFTVNVPTHEGYTPLQLATYFSQTHCHPDVVETLRNKATDTQANHDTSDAPYPHYVDTETYPNYED